MLKETMDRIHSTRFVASGKRDLEKELRPKIRDQVETEFSEQLCQSGCVGRWLIRREMKKEIDRRVADAVSLGSLY